MHYNKEGKLDGLQREYADSGKLTRDASFHDGLMQVEKLYYLNGQLKRLTEKKQENKRVFVTSKQYFDNGRLMRSGTFIEEQEVDNFGWGRYWDYSYLKPEGRLEEWREDGTRLYIETYKDGAQDGVSTYYFKDGKSIQREAVYEKGRMTRKKEYDEGGKLTLNEEYFEDGSRKSYSIK